jgi:DNA repair exonuclease SbcCD nuclease subunit
MIVFAADLHITEQVWRARKDLKGDAFRALAALKDQILALHKQEHVSVILGGDVFDSGKVRGPSLESFTEFVDTLYESDIPVYFIQGNHDRDLDRPIAEVQGAVSLHKTCTEIDGLMCYGLDWMTREELQIELQQIPGNVDVLILHGMAEHLLSFEAAADFSLDDIPTHVKHVLVGDIHVRDVFKYTSGTCVSPGPMHPTKIDQEGPFGFNTLRQGSTDWESYDIPGRPISRFVIMTEQEALNLEAALPAIQAAGVENYEPIVEVRYVSELAEFIERWMSKFTGIRFFTKPSAKGKLLSKEDITEAQKNFQELSLITSLSVVVDARTEKELHDFLHACLTGDALAVVEKKVEPFVQ